jgi:glyoxylase-like metal-dependent hydrolase (beta-lactamase superfamily II)
MALTAEATPATLPLPGGVADATVRVHPLLTGEVQAPPAFLARPVGRLAPLRALASGRDRSQWLWLPIPAFLVEHPGAGPILVDTGLHPSVAIDPAQSLGRAVARLARVRTEPGQAAPAQLRARGIEPRDVTTVVMTHMHYDHAGAVSEFPDATFVLDRREWEAATAPRSALRGYRAQQFDYGFDWRTIDYGAPEIGSFATFGAGVDLLGDGSIRLLATPGHSSGHQSVLLRTQAGEVLLCGDAAFTRRSIDDQVLPLVYADAHVARRSLREIRAFVERTPGLVAIPGHDPDTWPELRDAY